MKLFTAVVVCVPLLAGSAAADSIFVEGHVLNLRTGVPLRAASVLLTDPLTGVIIGSRSYPDDVVGRGLTDDSGFFSIELREVEPDRGPLAISATCRTPKAVRRTDRLTNRVVLRPGTLRRDLYIDAFRQRGAGTTGRIDRNRTCLTFFSGTELP